MSLQALTGPQRDAVIALARSELERHGRIDPWYHGQVSTTEPCPDCGGSTRCPSGCPQALEMLTSCRGPTGHGYHGRVAIREKEWGRLHEVDPDCPEDERMHVVQTGWEYGHDCDTCTIYGDCFGCLGSGRETLILNGGSKVEVYRHGWLGWEDRVILATFTTAAVERELRAPQGSLF